MCELAALVQVISRTAYELIAHIAKPLSVIDCLIMLDLRFIAKDF